jgi:hypothetical protein
LIFRFVGHEITFARFFCGAFFALAEGKRLVGMAVTGMAI